MNFLGNQIVNMMINKIKHNNPRMSHYIDEIQSGGDTSEILQKAIHNGDITRQQWMQVKPMLVQYGKQAGISVNQEDIHTIESAFSKQSTGNNYNGFRF